MRLLKIAPVLFFVGAAIFLFWERAPRISPSAGCLQCHQAQGPPGVHQSLDCFACHLGDPRATQADKAHRGLEREPGALDTVAVTCGQCHPQAVATLGGSLMTTAQGIIAVDRWYFGEIVSPESAETAALTLTATAPTPGQDHLRKLCLGCHLGTRKNNRDDVLTGASGCSACHAIPRPEGSLSHPTLDPAPADARCLGCHSRSGRISLSYQGQHEGPCAETLPDGRTVCSGPPDVHQKVGMACVDCHLHTELMGDGQSYRRQADAVEIQCISCHGPQASESTWDKNQDPVIGRVLARRGLMPQGPMRTGRRGTPIWNLSQEKDRWYLRSKLGAGRWAVPSTPTNQDHQQSGHENLSCAACHSQRAPLCLQCHIHYRPDEPQWDFGPGRPTVGRWVETGQDEGVFFTEPGLGRRGKKIMPAVLGMRARLNGAARPPLVAVFDPHTTGPGRGCASCHHNPQALGLGAGTLTFEPGPRFQPVSSGPTGWQDLATTAAGTRAGQGGLSPAQMARVLRVGYCLSCHAGAEVTVFADFGASLEHFLAGGAKRCSGKRALWLKQLPPDTARP